MLIQYCLGNIDIFRFSAKIMQKANVYAMILGWNIGIESGILPIFSTMDKYEIYISLQPKKNRG